MASNKYLKELLRHDYLHIHLKWRRMLCSLPKPDFMYFPIIDEKHVDLLFLIHFSWFCPFDYFCICFSQRSFLITESWQIKIIRNNRLASTSRLLEIISPSDPFRFQSLEERMFNSSPCRQSGQYIINPGNQFLSTNQQPAIHPSCQSSLTAITMETQIFPQCNSIGC